MAVKGDIEAAILQREHQLVGKVRVRARIGDENFEPAGFTVNLRHDARPEKITASNVQKHRRQESVAEEQGELLRRHGSRDAEPPMGCGAVGSNATLDDCSNSSGVAQTWPQLAAATSSVHCQHHWLKRFRRGWRMASGWMGRRLALMVVAGLLCGIGLASAAHAQSAGSHTRTRSKRR